MTRILSSLISLLSFLVFSLAVSAQEKSDLAMNQFIDQLMSRMTLEEKTGQLVLYTGGMSVTGSKIDDNYMAQLKKGKVGAIFNMYTPEVTRQLQEVAVTQTRLKIPLLFGYDVIHGHKTIFPIPLGESSSWDLQLMQKTARVAATEAAADGLHWTFAPMVDIARDPRWGRISEGAGEDTWLGSKIAQARVQGFQGNDLAATDTVLACVKHFAAYGAPVGGRDYNTVDMSLRTLLGEYLPPYKAALDAGAATVMTSFNEISGVPATADQWLLTELLRKQWGFKGFVVTDYTSINELIPHGVAADEKSAGELALKAGVDMDMQGGIYSKYASSYVKSGRVSEEALNQAVRRILEAKYRLGLFKDPYRYSDEERAKNQIMTQAHLDLARSVARESIVLLKNKNSVLPLKKKGTIALIGPFVENQRDLIGNWSGAGDWKKSVSLQVGVTEAIKGIDGIKILSSKGANISDDEKLVAFLNQHGGDLEIPKQTSEQMIKEAVEVAKQADVVVMALGESQGMSGEAASRSRVRLPENQQELLRAVQKTGKPVVLLLFNGRPLALAEESSIADALVETWFLGHQSGHAIADVLFGEHNPSGKLTVSFPYNEGQIPIYYSVKNTGRPFDTKNKYTSKYLDVPNEPLYPFGWGLSYTEFSYSKPQLNTRKLLPNQTLEVSVKVKNTGARAGAEVVQLYLRDLVGSVTRPVKELRGFQKVYLQKGESQLVKFQITVEDLKFYNAKNEWVAETGKFQVMVGGSSVDLKTTEFSLVVPGEEYDVQMVR